MGVNTGVSALHGHRGGATFEAVEDTIRLNDQADDVWRVMHGGKWFSLRTLSQATGHPEASISARMRDFRKSRFGSHTVERHAVGKGLHLYRLVPNPTVKVAVKDGK